jgi:predicted aspartyl protease
MTIRRIAASVCVLVALAASSPPAVQEFPFDFKTRQPILSVRVNGGPAVPFVVDTGATIHVIDRDILRESTVASGRSSQLSGGGQATVDVRFVDGLTFAVGGTTWSEQRAAVAPLGYPDRKHFAGLLGAPILTRYTVQFDFPSQRMRLIDPATYRPPSGAVLVPFELYEDLPIVHVTLDAGGGPIDARLMVDTGASAFIDLNRPFVETHRLVEIVRDAKPLDRPAALGGTAPFLYGTARRVALAGLVFDGPRLGLSRAQSGSSSRSERDGILGNDLLRQFIVTVDYRRKTLVLERP